MNQRLKDEQLLKKKKNQQPSIKALCPAHNLRTSNMITHKNHKQVIGVVYFIVAGCI